MDNELLQAISSIIKEEIKPVKDDIKDVKDELKDVKDDINNVKEQLGNLEHNVLKLNLTVENELRPNIQLLAEGHTDIVERLKRLDEKAAEIEDIKDTVSVLKALTVKNK